MGRFKPIDQLEKEKGKLYGDQAARKANTPAPMNKLEPRCPPNLPAGAKKAWHEAKQSLQNWGLFNDANAPHLEMYAVNRHFYLHYRELALEFEKHRPKVEDKPRRNPFLGHMNKFEQKMRFNLHDMMLGAAAMAKGGSAVARAKKIDELDLILD